MCVKRFLKDAEVDIALEEGGDVHDRNPEGCTSKS